MAVPRQHIAALRVSALDAERLDVELTDMLRQQFLSILANVQPVCWGGSACTVGSVRNQCSMLQ